MNLILLLGVALVSLVVGVLIGANNPGLVKSAAHKIEADATAAAAAVKPATAAPKPSAPAAPAAPSTAPPAK